MHPRILVADDQPDVLEALKLLLKGEGYEVESATSPRAVLSALDKRDFDALLIDMNYTRDTTSGAEGLDLLARLQGLDAPPPVVVMTAWASIDGAVEAMRRGARDFIEKPWDNRRLLTTLRTQVELSRALRRSQQLERENRALRREGLPELIAESPAMQPVLTLMERIGPSDANVLILGEHGTGKEVVARPAVSPQDRRDPTAAAARAARRHPAARRSFWAPPRRALSQADHRLRGGRDAGPAGASLARQRARARPHDRAIGVDGRGKPDSNPRPGTRARGGGGWRHAARSDEPRGSGASAHSEGAGARQRQRERRGESARPLPQPAVPPDQALWPLSDAISASRATSAASSRWPSSRGSPPSSSPWCCSGAATSRRAHSGP